MPALFKKQRQQGISKLKERKLIKNRGKKTEEEEKCYRWRQSMNRLLHVLQVAHTLGESVQLALVYSYGPVSVGTLKKQVGRPCKSRNINHLKHEEYKYKKMGAERGLVV
jgi:chromosome segregation and condensation protein ScpB